jgi:hypothetical protein
MFVYKIKPHDIYNLVDIVHCYYNLDDFQNAHYWVTKLLEIEPNDEYANEMIEKINSKIN